MRRATASYLVLVLALLLGAPARADEPLDPGASQVVIAGWMERLSQAEELLRAEEWKKVRRRMDSLLREMKGRLWAGPSAASLLARGSALRAIAQAGLGELDEAAWDWDVAKSLEPDLEHLDFGPFGEAGAFFSSAEYGDRTRLAGTAPEAAEQAGEDGESEGSRITPPRKLYAPPPPYPRAKYYACKEEPLLLATVIDRQGRPRAPKLLGAGDPVLFFAASETVRTWRFEPARIDGRAVTVIYQLTVNYRVRVCPGVGRGIGD